jgi:AbrB-like transcriptional regulator
MKTKVKPQIYNKVRTSVGVQADFCERDIPKGTVGTIVECYEDPEGYAVDLAIPDQKLVGGFDYENVILEPNQFELISAASQGTSVRKGKELKGTPKKGMAPVTGKELLKKVEELKGTPKKKMARALGFVSKTKTGQERIKLASFMNALLEAKGVGFGGASERDGCGGRSASYRIQVQQNGSLLVGAVYTCEMGLEPGTEFEIQLGHKHIKLVKVDGGDGED